MSRAFRVIVTSAVVVFALSSSSQAITRVGKKLNVIEFYGGYAGPLGTYNGIPIDEFIIEGRQWEFEADEVYGASYYFGLNYGQLFANRFLISAGFRYTRHDLKDTIGNDEMAFMYDFKPNLHQYDLDLNLNYLFTNLHVSGFAPYVGLGMHGGIASATWEGFDSENELTFAMSVNFGAEVKLYTAASGRSFVTLASMNNWNFLSTNDRPKYLHIGGGIKYYFRP
jgi:hypothetical protein